MVFASLQFVALNLLEVFTVSSLLLCLLLVLASAGFLALDLFMAWEYYRARRSNAVFGRLFIRWWLNKSRALLFIVGGILVVVSCALFLQRYTLVLPDIGGKYLTKKVRWGLIAAVIMTTYVLFDLFMAWRFYQNNGWEQDARGGRFYQWWFKKSALKFCVVSIAGCLALGSVWVANRYLLKPKAETSGSMGNAKRYFGQKKYREAIIELRNALQKNRDDYEAQLWLARSFRQSGSLTEARDAYREALRIEPKLYTAHLELGRLAVALKDRNLALAEAQEAARMEPAKAEPRLLLAQIYSSDGMRDQALEQCRAIISREFTAPEFRQQFIILLLRQHAYAEALQAAESGLVKNPADVMLNSMKAQALAGSERFKEARLVLRATARSNNTSAEPYIVLGDLLTRRGEYLAALQEYEKALEISPHDERAMNNFASLNAEFGFDMERSASLAARLHAKNPRDPLVADTLGWTLFRQGKLEQALPLLRQGGAAMPNNPNIHYHLGAALMMSGQHDAGIRELRSALRISGSFEGAERARLMLKEKG